VCAGRALIEQESSSSTHNLTDNDNATARDHTPERTVKVGAHESNVPENHHEVGAEAARKEPEPSAKDENLPVRDKKRWHDKPGYSSGASSSFGDSFVLDGSASEGSSRGMLDPLHLTSMRHVLHSNGDLTQAVVRLEVRERLVHDLLLLPVSSIHRVFIILPADALWQAH
jgi:hypothetical protein